MKITWFSSFFYFLLTTITGCASETGNHNAAVNNGNNPIPAKVEVVKLSNDEYEFLEGPAWDGKNSVYFTDIPQNSIYKYNLNTKKFDLVTSALHEPNGLMFSNKNTLYTCEHKTGSLIELDKNGTKLSVLAGSYNGAPFNQPNDLVIDKQGGVYFTDPSWNEDRPQVTKGVYYRNSNGKTKLLVKDMDKPNGIILSTDESTLYINDSDSFEVRAYGIAAPGQLGAKQTFAFLHRPEGYQGNNTAADGMAIDIHGNLYITTKFGIQVFDKNGKKLGIIDMPEPPSNCAFAGKNLDTLFVTARKNTYMIKLNTTGLRFPQS